MSKADRLKKERAERVVEPATPVGPTLTGPAWEEFTKRLNELAVAHSFAVRGLPPQADELMKFVTQQGGDLDKPAWIIPSGPWGNKMPSYGEIRQRDLPSFLAPAGPVAISLGQQWAVAVFTEWDVTYRKRIESDLGLKKDELKIPALGDIRRFRNDIVHHRGVATAKDSGKVEVFTDWCSLDQPIIIGEHQIVAFMDELGLVKWEEQDTSDEIKKWIDAYEAEKARRGGGDFVMRRTDMEAAAALADVVQCPKCRQRSRTEGPDCPVCGAPLPGR